MSEYNSVGEGERKRRLPRKRAAGARARAPRERFEELSESRWTRRRRVSRRTEAPKKHYTELLNILEDTRRRGVTVVTQPLRTSSEQVDSGGHGETVFSAIEGEPLDRPEEAGHLRNGQNQAEVGPDGKYRKHCEDHRCRNRGLHPR